MPDIITSANVKTLMESADFAAFRTSLGLTALATTTPGTGVAAALAINVGSAGAFLTFNGAGGTPSSMVGTNITGTAAGLTAGAVAVGGITGLGANVGTFLATPSSANLLAAVTDETGTGALVFGTSPTLTTPTISGAVTFPDGVRQTFNPDATNAGINVGSHTADPSTPSNGDLWYATDSNALRARINGATVSLGAGGGGSPGGADTQVQFNDGGAFGGDAGLTYNKTTDTLTTVSQSISETSSSTVGVQFKGATRFLHNYNAATSDGGNLFLGKSAGNFTMGPGGGASVLSSNNVGVGEAALTALTTGYYNACVGFNAGDALTTGNTNTAIGGLALTTNTTGGGNVAVGYQALRFSTTSDNNVAVGSTAMSAATTATNNVAVGVQSMNTNADGSSNVAIGAFAMLNATGSGVTYNVCVGTNALRTMTTGDANTAIGGQSMRLTTSGHNNTAVGVLSLEANTTGIWNVAVGTNALVAAVDNYNTAVGGRALFGLTSGADNVAVGKYAGYGDGSTANHRSITDSQVVFIGSGASKNSASVLSNCIAIGYNSKVTASNTAVIGNTSLVRLIIGAGNLNIPSPSVPATAGATGVAGDIAWDSGFIYVCTATNTWKRVAIATW